MLKLTIKNKKELLKDYERAQELMDELSKLFYKMGIVCEIEEEPSDKTDSSK